MASECQPAVAIYASHKRVKFFMYLSQLSFSATKKMLHEKA